ncbi:uncharacterized protein [Leptinotarsa decemlineata]|uniref:uncharacterized protein n=1 Tax=Leptinotarsa decemlineata TaxID=7539 RepID=UPI003D30D62B
MSSTQPTLIESYNVTSPSNGASELAGTFAGEAEAAGNAYERPETSSPRSLQVNQTQKSISELLYNGTGFYIEDEIETGLSDLQTILLTSVATLIFLIAVFFTAFGIRLLWKSYRRRKENSQYDGILHREGTSESISRPLHSHLLADKNYTEADLTVHAETVEICDSIGVNNQTRSSNHSNTNGSIITMTLKNNHLIVETEERNDLVEDSRETTMKYSPGARDGIFVVEVQQGLRRSPGSGGPISCPEQETSISISDQCALVHNPPDRYSDEETIEEYDDSEYYIETISPNRDTPDSIISKTKTGLTQSNTSLSHPSYCYTNQECYDIGNYGYSVDPSYMSEGIRRDTDDTRPKIMAAIYKNTLKRSPSTEDLHLAAINGVDEIVNDVFRASSEDEMHLEEQMRLGNAKKTEDHSPKVKQVENDISQAVREEAETRSVDCENEGFDCNDSVKS